MFLKAAIFLYGNETEYLITFSRNKQEKSRYGPVRTLKHILDKMKKVYLKKVSILFLIF